MMRFCLLFTLLAICLGTAEGVFFKIKQNHEKCFIELLDKDEVMIVEYKSPDQAELPPEPEAQTYHVGIAFKVVNSKGTVFQSRADKEGRFAFTSPENGEHRFCFTVEGHSLGQDFRVHLDIKAGLDNEDPNAVVKREHLGAMELKVRNIGDSIERVKKEQKYFRAREVRFKQTSDSTNFRAQWFSVIQIVGMIVVTALHVGYLRHYFMAKKLV